MGHIRQGGGHDVVPLGITPVTAIAGCCSSARPAHSRTSVLIAIVESCFHTKSKLASVHFFLFLSLSFYKVPVYAVVLCGWCAYDSVHPTY